MSWYARGAYLGPVLGSTGHLVQIKLDSGELKRIVAPGLKLLYPLRFDVELVPGFQGAEGYLQPRDGDRYKELTFLIFPEVDLLLTGSDSRGPLGQIRLDTPLGALEGTRSGFETPLMVLLTSLRGTTKVSVLPGKYQNHPLRG